MSWKDHQNQSNDARTLRAAQYVRMSTEHQRYSTENQSDEMFRYAGHRGIEIVRTYSDEGKSGLRIQGRHGLQQLIDDVRSSNAYKSRFGSLLRAYRLVGFKPDRDYRYIEINRQLRLLHPDILVQTVSGIEAVGGNVTRDAESDLLTINGEFRASIVIVRCHETNAGSLRWNIRFDMGLRPDITVAVRMDRPNREPLDYYLLPSLDMTLPRIRLAENNGLSLDAYRFETLDPLFRLAAHIPVPEVA